jgi:hypothetical protein
MNHKDILGALDQQFSTNATSVFINSLNTEISFRDITVKEQKTITKIIIDNPNREDVVYESTLAMIQSLCLTPGFDILSLSEFDRLKILLTLYKQNFFNDKVEYTCRYCDHSGHYELDFSRIEKSLDTIDISNKIYEVENNTHNFIFNIGYPNVKNVRAYFKQLIKDKNDKNTVNKINALDYIDLFIKDIKIVNKADHSKEINVSLENCNINDVEEILAKLPQGILLNRSGTSLMDKISKEFLASVNTVFNYARCGACGKDIELNIGFSDFFLQ